jgi:hypothetical protein
MHFLSNQDAFIKAANNSLKLSNTGPKGKRAYLAPEMETPPRTAAERR